jgi:hypothetical protein
MVKRTCMSTAGCQVTVYDLPGLLAVLTGTRARAWKSQNGPDTRCGVDYYYAHSSGKEAYINIDQGHFTVAVDGETIFSGDPTEDPKLKRFISEQ